MNEDRIDEILEVVEEESVDLDADPISKGPKWLNGKVAKCRNLTTKIQAYEREVERSIMLYERKLNKLEAEYDMKFNDQLSNNNEVKQLTAAADRRAKAKDNLKDLKSEIREAEGDLTDMKHVRSVVKSKVRELREVTSNIRLQRDLIKQEMKLGADQGDNLGTDDPDKHIEPGDVDVEDTESDTEGESEEEDVDLSEMVDEETDVDPDEIEELFGGSSEDSQEDYDSALAAIETEPSNDFEDSVPSSGGGSSANIVVSDEDDDVDLDGLFDDF